MEIKIKKEIIEKGQLIEVSKSPKIIIYFDGEKYYAVSGICPHAKWPLELGFVNKTTLTCGGHGWEFDIEDGNCITNPGRNLKNYSVLEANDEIIISEN